MDYPKYAVEVSLTCDYYEFMSFGKKGAIQKGILFSQSNENSLIYICVLGDVQEDGSLDTNTVSNNGDLALVLATVADSALKFLSQYPDCNIYIEGSNKTRTRLYRIAINTNYNFLMSKFKIFGILKNDSTIEEFNEGSTIDYDAFLVKRKK